eukprot:2764903-Prymnesium_polylepis.1
MQHALLQRFERGETAETRPDFDTNRLLIETPVNYNTRALRSTRSPDRETTTRKNAIRKRRVRAL